MKWAFDIEPSAKFKKLVLPTSVFGECFKSHPRLDHIQRGTRTQRSIGLRVTRLVVAANIGFLAWTAWLQKNDQSDPIGLG